jgi:5'-3' exonuclease
MEADDIAAIIARDYQKYEKIIVTSDGDYTQLLKYNNVKIWDPIKMAFVKSDDPQKDLQIKILMGDKGDNIPSVKPRVGEKTAEKLMNNPDLLKEMFSDTTPSYTQKDGTVVTMGEEYREKYKLNTALIDLSRIPDVLTNALKKNMAEYQLPSGKDIFTYFSKNKFREFMRRMQEIEQIIGLIVDSPRIPKNTSTDISDAFSGS